MKAIYLTGFMGAGKTTIGIALAEYMNLRVIDLDDYIEEKLSTDISSIFKSEGEAYFRNQEQLALREISSSDLIITTGGGVVLRKENRTHMKQNGLVIHLNASVETIYDRLSEGGQRPLANGKSKNEIAQMIERRKTYYEDAHVSIATDDKSIEEIVEEISSWIKSVVIA